MNINKGAHPSCVLWKSFSDKVLTELGRIHKKHTAAKDRDLNQRHRGIKILNNIAEL